MRQIGAGGVRGSQSEVAVVVLLNGKPVTAAAKVTVATPDGTVLMSGSTQGGLYVSMMDSGTYTVTATTAHNTASGSVTVTNPSAASVVLDLTPKPAK